MNKEEWVEVLKKQHLVLGEITTNKHSIFQKIKFVTASCMHAVRVPAASALHTVVLDIYRYTLVHRYAGAPVYYLGRRYTSV